MYQNGRARMTPDRYASVSERITWTTGFSLAIDKHVLGTLSTFANFKTGRRADMALDTLADRAKVNRRTLLRSLKRLERDGWIVARRRHRHPTTYDIDLGRLATHWMEAKVVTVLSDTGVTQQPVQNGLSDIRGPLSDTGVTQQAGLSDTGVTPSPVRTDPQFDPLYPALRADVDGTGTTEDRPEAKVEGPQQLTFGPGLSTAPTPDQLRQLEQEAREDLEIYRATMAPDRFEATVQRHIQAALDARRRKSG